MKLSVFGLGYVGSVSAGCFAALGHEVVGVDVNPTKVAMINDGQSPVIEADLDALIREARAAGRLWAVTDAAEAVAATDLSLVCVGTPSNSNGDLDLTYVTRVCEQIGLALAEKASAHTVILRSTVLPNTCEEVVIPALEGASGRQAGDGLRFAYNPEFLREGSAVRDFYEPPFTVIGAYDSQGAHLAGSLYTDIEAPLVTVPLAVAEMVKYANNAYHALKVTFANEIGNVCKLHGIDSHEVMDIFCMDDKLNISPAYLRPRFAFGGSCLPKDLRALLYAAHHKDLSVPVLEAILPSNDLQIRHGYEMIRSTGSKRVGVLGFSFKAGTDDLRESPIVELIEMLIGKGYQVSLYDRNVSLARLQGANRVYIEREIPHIASLMRDSMEAVIAESDIVVIGNESPEFIDIMERIHQDQVVIDLVRILKDIPADPRRYQGISW